MAHVYLTYGRKNDKPEPTISDEMRKQAEKTFRKYNKKIGDELQEYLQFRRRGSVVESCKGKSPYKRNDKHKNSHLTND